MAFHERENDPAILWGEEHGCNGGTTVENKGLRCYESTVSCGSSYSSWSDLSSPFGSELESTSESTESEEDEEFISELTRKMAESMLQDDDEEDDEPKQQLVQDPELPVNWSDSGSKAGSVCYNFGFTPKSEKPCIESVSNVNSVENSADEQLGPIHVGELKNQQGGVSGGGRAVMAAETAALLQREKQSTQNRGGGGGGGGRGWKHGGGGAGKKNSIPVFPAGSGMRAVFLGGSDRSGCSGTGVFLPTAGGYSKPEPKRKSGCSTVLIPARVLQTLQQHFNTVGAPSPSNATAGGGGGGTPDLPWRNDVLARINGLLSQKKEHAELHPRPRPPPPPTYAAVVEASHHPVVPELPQEWTY